MNTENNFLGYMYIAKRPCGKVSATFWEEKGSEKELAKAVSRWIKRGNVVERIARYENDSLPEMICYIGCKECV